MSSNKMALDALTEFDEALTTWANAYPESVFPSPDLAKAAKLLEAGGMTLDAISADAMRHIAKTMHADFADCRAAIAALQAEPQGWMPIETAPLFVPLQDAIPPCLVWGKKLGLCMGSAGRDKFGHVYVQANGLCGDVRDLATHYHALPATPPKD